MFRGRTASRSSRNRGMFSRPFQLKRARAEGRGTRSRANHRPRAPGLRSSGCSASSKPCVCQPMPPGSTARDAGGSWGRSMRASRKRGPRRRCYSRPWRSPGRPGGAAIRARRASPGSAIAAGPPPPGGSAPNLGRKVRAGQQNAVAPRGEVGLNERLGQSGAILASAELAKNEPSLGESQRRQRVAALRPVARQPRPLVEITRVTRLCGHIRGECVLPDRVVEGWIAVDPDRVIITADRFVRCRLAPLAADGLRIVQHVAKAEHATATARFLQRLQRSGPAPARPPGGPCRRSRRPARTPPAPRPAQSTGCASFPAVTGRDRAPQPAVSVLAQRGEREAIDPGRKRQRARFSRPGEQQDDRSHRRPRQRLGDQEVPPHVAQAHGVVRVERDPARRSRGSGRGAGVDRRLSMMFRTSRLFISRMPHRVTTFDVARIHASPASSPTVTRPTGPLLPPRPDHRSLPATRRSLAPA